MARPLRGGAGEAAEQPVHLQHWSPAMSLISLIVALVIFGLLLWIVDALLPIEPKIKNIVKILIVIVFVLWLLQYLNVFVLSSHL
jgi:bacteriorhodopsin